MARLTRRLRREKTNARVIPGSTVFDAPGMFLPRYGKSHFLISGTGQPGTVLVAGNQVYNNDGNAVTNASTPGNIIGYNPPTGGNAVGNNPPTVGDYVLQVYELQTGPGPDGPNSSYENYSTEAGYGPHDPGYSTYGVFPAYDGTPPSTQYHLRRYVYSGQYSI
jgi:hypothetical protein